MFRLQNNVPDVYVNNSRDFQLLCRLYDSVFAGVKFSIDSLQHSSSTYTCDESLLPLLKTKVGLFIDQLVDSEELRQLLEAFPYIIRYKGSLTAITYMLNAYSRIMKINMLEGSLADSSIARIDREALKHHILRVTLSKKFENSKLLTELLKFIIPSGFLIEYVVESENKLNDQLVVNDKLILDSSSSSSKFAKINSRSNDSPFESVIGVAKVTENTD